MKKSRKFLAILMVFAMIMSMGVFNAFAAEGTLTGGSITINDAVPGNTYNAYQILYLESYNPTTSNYSYKANSAWEAWLKTQHAYLTIDDNGYVTWVAGADIAAFAKLAAEQLEGKTPDATATAPEAAEGAEYSTVVMSDLKLGGYLVDTTLGTICSLDTTDPNAVIKEKNEKPSVEKAVKENPTGHFGKANDANIGDTVEFVASIKVQTGAVNYILHDEMSAGLTYTGVTAVKIGEAVVNEDNYTVTTSVTDQCDFEVKFNNTYIAGLDADTVIDVYYSAVLNENAVVGNTGNPNKVRLTYGEKPTPDSTPESTTTTYTWDMRVVKYAENGGAEVMLAGAKFELSTDHDGNDVISLHNLGDNKYAACFKTGCTNEHVTEIETDATGTFNIEGLDSATYYLTETQAPAGYNKLAGPKSVQIHAASTSAGTALGYTTVEAKILNQSGTELPGTGGMGTVIFVAVGSLMVAAAVVFLVTKKRMRNMGI